MMDKQVVVIPTVVTPEIREATGTTLDLITLVCKCESWWYPPTMEDPGDEGFEFDSVVYARPDGTLVDILMSLSELTLAPLEEQCADIIDQQRFDPSDYEMEDSCPQEGGDEFQPSAGKRAARMS